ncbi:hypothetical protein ACF1GW_23120 [Streptomyces achromogenes]|uniref:hypothetical protein n=1 Tax=Streptomyces achromogenes TaxID=67255 RepID=UPI0036FEB3C3
MDVRVAGRVLREVYLAPFEAAVEAGVWLVMAAYNSVNGTTITLEVSSPASDGLVELETVTPVLIKYRDRWLLPWDEHQCPAPAPCARWRRR